MKKGKRSGVTVLELMIAGFLFALLSGIVFKLFSLFWSNNQKLEQKDSIKIGATATLGELKQRAANVALVFPAEGLFSPGDGLYPGIATLNHAVAELPNCKYELEGSGPSEKFSILRYSQHLSHTAPERTLKAFRVSANLGMRTLDISRHPAGTSPIHLFQLPNENPPKEIIVVDDDDLQTERFRVFPGDVVSATSTQASQQASGEENTPPPPPISMDISKVTLRRAQTISNQDQNVSGVTFVTGSPVYGVSTRFICVDTEGKLVSIEEEGGTTEILANPNTIGGTIEKFNVLFYGTRTGETLTQASFTQFPYSDAGARMCINTALLTLRISVKNPTTGETEYRDFSEVILLDSFNRVRPATCL